MTRTRNYAERHYNIGESTIIVGRRWLMSSDGQPVPSLAWLRSNSGGPTISMLRRDAAGWLWSHRAAIAKS